MELWLNYTLIIGKYSSSLVNIQHNSITEMSSSKPRGWALSFNTGSRCNVSIFLIRHRHSLIRLQENFFCFLKTFSWVFLQWNYLSIFVLIIFFESEIQFQFHFVIWQSSLSEYKPTKLSDKQESLVFIFLKNEKIETFAWKVCSTINFLLYTCD